jgi:hypothetical protein
MKIYLCKRKTTLIVLLLLFTNFPIKGYTKPTENDTEAQVIKKSNTSHEIESSSIPDKTISSTVITKKVAVLFMTFDFVGSTPVSINPISDIQTNYMVKIIEYWSDVTGGKIQLDAVYSENSNPAAWIPVLSDCPIPNGPSTPCDELGSPEGVINFVNYAVSKNEDRFNFPDYEIIFIWTSALPEDLVVFTDSPSNSIPIRTDDPPGTIQPMVSIVPEGDPDYDPHEEIWSIGAEAIGHNLGLSHTHGSLQKRSKYELMANGRPSGLSIYSLEEGEWFETSRQLIVNPGYDYESIEVIPRNLNEINEDEMQSIKVPRADRNSGTYYYLEVIQQQDEDSFSPMSGVLLYLVTPNDHTFLLRDINSHTNKTVLTDGGLEDILYSTDPAKDGFNETIYEIEDDPSSAKLYTISINITGGDPSTGAYFIDISYVYFTEDVLRPDLMISAWGAPLYESKDIWVDNDENGWGQYAFSDLYLTADYPEVDDINMLVVNVTNCGKAPAHDLRVNFWDRGLSAGVTWGYNPIGVNDTINLLNPNFSVNVTFPWTPANLYGLSADPNTGIIDLRGRGTCLYVNVEPDEDEASASLWNNGGTDPLNAPTFDLRTQENVHYIFDPSVVIPPIPNTVASPNINTELPYEYQEHLLKAGHTIDSLADTLSIKHDVLVSMLVPRKITFAIGNPFPSKEEILVTFVNPNGHWYLPYNQSGSVIDKLYTLDSGEDENISLWLMPVPVGADVGTPLIGHIVVLHAENITVTNYTTIQGQIQKENNLESTFQYKEIAISPFGGISIDGRLLYRSLIQINSKYDASEEKINVSGSLSLTGISGIDIGNILPNAAYSAKLVNIKISTATSGYLIEEIVPIKDNTGEFSFTFPAIEGMEYSIFAVYAGSDKIAPSKSREIEIQATYTAGTNWILSVSIIAIIIIGVVYRYGRKKPKYDELSLK